MSIGNNRDVNWLVWWFKSCFTATYLHSAFKTAVSELVSWSTSYSVWPSLVHKIWRFLNSVIKGKLSPPTTERGNPLLPEQVPKAWIWSCCLEVHSASWRRWLAKRHDIIYRYWLFLESPYWTIFQLWLPFNILSMKILENWHSLVHILMQFIFYYIFRLVVLNLHLFAFSFAFKLNCNFARYYNDGSLPTQQSLRCVTEHVIGFLTTWDQSHKWKFWPC